MQRLSNAIIHPLTKLARKLGRAETIADISELNLEKLTENFNGLALEFINEFSSHPAYEELMVILREADEHVNEIKKVTEKDAQLLIAVKLYHLASSFISRARFNGVLSEDGGEDVSDYSTGFYNTVAKFLASNGFRGKTFTGEFEHLNNQTEQ